MLKLTALAALLLLGCAAFGESPQPRAEGDAAALGRGSLAFGSAPEAIEARLGRPVATEMREGFEWRTHRAGGREVALGYYNEMLGQVRVTGPMDWPEARTWATTFSPGFDESKVLKDDPRAWAYFEAITVQGLPFEAGLTFRREGETVTAIEGEMNWLD